MVTVTVTHASDGSPAPGQRVCLDTAGTNCQTTDANGKVVFEPVKNGAHRIFVNGAGCCQVMYTGIPINKNCTV